MRRRRAHRHLNIATYSELERFANRLAKQRIIGVDLEADSMYHFREKVCLIQIATSHTTAVIDPLQLDNLTVLKPVFKRRDILKVFHGADYDIRSLYRDFKININNLFDTELACRFLGFKETGLEAVLKKRYNVRLDKKYQRKDWSKRPLPQEMIAYAAKDVRYLIPLAKSLQQELKNKGRLGWVEEECHHLSRVRPANNNSRPLFVAFKGAGKLGPRGLAVLEELLQMRKKIALRQDKPLFRIIGNKSLLKLAEARPQNLTKLKKSEILGSKQFDRYGSSIMAAVTKARQIPTKNLPKYPRKTAPMVPAIVAKRVKELRTWRDRMAEQLKVDPAIICTKALISAIAVQKPVNKSSLSKIKGLKNWQVTEFGRDIINILNTVG
ncbi:MAG: HRDC domain-containing protein [Desulfobacterales bacterium]|nr:HRDC domain-containing protein [Desulfobacterales bacterium]